MLGEILEFVFDILVEFIPNAVWKFFCFLIGIVVMAIGTTIVNDSMQTGGALIVVGMLLMIGSLVSLYR